LGFGFWDKTLPQTQQVKKGKWEKERERTKAGTWRKKRKDSGKKKKKKGFWDF
jgi:hypothetical protein